MGIEDQEYYILFGITKAGRKEVTLRVVTKGFRKSLDRRIAEDVISKHIIKATDAKKRYPNYKIARYNTPQAAEEAGRQFLNPS